MTYIGSCLLAVLRKVLLLFACHFNLGFCLLAVSACTMTTRRTNNSLAASLDGENSPSDTLLHAESSVPSSLASAANSAPRSSSTVSAPVVAAGVHDPALIAVIVDAVKSSLAGRKRPWLYLEQFAWKFS